MDRSGLVARVVIENVASLDPRPAETTEYNWSSLISSTRPEMIARVRWRGSFHVIADRLGLPAAVTEIGADGLRTAKVAPAHRR